MPSVFAGAAYFPASGADDAARRGGAAGAEAENSTPPTIAVHNPCPTVNAYPADPNAANPIPNAAPRTVPSRTDFVVRLPVSGCWRLRLFGHGTDRENRRVVEERIRRAVLSMKEKLEVIRNIAIRGQQD